ncbi:MAG: tRNA lysidine(34) synthetase TilS [Proteobacteria bacterium]|nr:tRNA lysidine(34) synthetase TilS [Pseudomonadota bacterium]
MTRDAVGPFVNAVFETISQFDMIQRKDKILVGVSGGPDSVTLVKVLLDLKETFDLTLGIAHLNHGLRGDASLRDESFVKDLADKVRLPFFSQTLEINAMAKKERLSIEEAGRKARYAFFDKIAAANKFTKIATGHTLDDNAELMLMNLLRGAGPRGLSGIPPVRSNRFIRPLIQTPKSEILAFLKKTNQPFVVDASNADETYLRNKIRHSLIPRLEQDFNPKIKSSLDRLSQIFRQEDEFLELQATQAFHLCIVEQTPSMVALSIPKLARHHQVLARRVLRQAIFRVKQDLRRISLAHIRDILAFMTASESGKSLDLPGQIRIYKTRNRLCIKKETLPLRELGKTQKPGRQDETKKPTGKS